MLKQESKPPVSPAPSARFQMYQIEKVNLEYYKTGDYSKLD